MPGLLDMIRTKWGIGAGTWPPPDLRHVWDEVEKYIAYRLSDEVWLRQQSSTAWWQQYLISPVPRMISRASAHLLFSEAPAIAAEADSDQANLDRIIEDNDLDAELHRAAMISSSEGEVWGRICVRPDLLDVPILEFVTRRRVIPHFAGRFLVGASFLTEWRLGLNSVLRLFETYEPGQITSTVYQGTDTSIGTMMDLNAYQQTQGTPPLIFTGIAQPLCVFIPNSIDSDPCRGYSDYLGLEDRFLAINRASTIGDTNTELAGKKRALLDAEFVGPNGEVPGDDIFVSKREQSSVAGTASPLQLLEYSYDAGQIVTWLDHLIDSTLTFGGTAPQLVGRSADGFALSGTALRLKMIHSILESTGKGRFFDRGLGQLLRFAMIIDGRPTTEIGFGRPYTKRDAKPSIERTDALPQDDLEASSVLSGLFAADAISVEERVRYLHPRWAQTRVDEEVKLIKAETAAAAPPPPPSVLPVLPAG